MLHSEVLERGHRTPCRAMGEGAAAGPKAEQRRGDPNPESLLEFLREGAAGRGKKSLNNTSRHCDIRVVSSCLVLSPGTPLDLGLAGGGILAYCMRGKKMVGGDRVWIVRFVYEKTVSWPSPLLSLKNWLSLGRAVFAQVCEVSKCTSVKKIENIVALVINGC